uniref:Uncharacterized protein n=1 Tax=Rhizophora mucronata TaxID=61149 RepID=A0A2P2QE07_RHIMU
MYVLSSKVLVLTFNFLGKLLSLFGFERFLD